MKKERVIMQRLVSYKTLKGLIEYTGPISNRDKACEIKRFLDQISEELNTKILLIKDLAAGTEYVPLSTMLCWTKDILINMVDQLKSSKEKDRSSIQVRRLEMRRLERLSRKCDALLKSLPS